MRRAATLLCLLAVLAATALPGLAGAAMPKVAPSEIEAEVMCPICGELLELAESPQALREKAFVRRLIAEGRTRAEIKDALVAQYGPAVLAQPEGSGFDLSAYLVPVIAFALAAGALAAGIWRWRRRDGGDPGAPSPPPRAEDAERLDADIARYDL